MEIESALELKCRKYLWLPPYDKNPNRFKADGRLLEELCMCYPTEKVMAMIDKLVRENQDFFTEGE